jgi:two-component system, chemotaxis family, chemotaxis protein CheY
MQSMKKQILAIDESKAIRFLLQTVLSKQHQVVTAADGHAALYWLSKKNLPDIIIVDPEMPDMQNWELIEHLKTSGLYGSIPMIVISALDKKETERKCRELGIDEYFQQPFNPEELEKAIDRVAVKQKSRPSFLRVV